LPFAAGRERPRGIAALSAGPKSRARQRLPQHRVLLVVSKERRETKGLVEYTINRDSLLDADREARSCSVTASTLKASLLNRSSSLARTLVRIKHSISRLENFFFFFLQL
jgi:hypothetical protein